MKGRKGKFNRGECGFEKKTRVTGKSDSVDMFDIYVRRRNDLRDIRCRNSFVLRQTTWK